MIEKLRTEMRKLLSSTAEMLIVMAEILSFTIGTLLPATLTTVAYEMIREMGVYPYLAYFYVPLIATMPLCLFVLLLPTPYPRLNLLKRMAKLVTVFLPIAGGLAMAVSWMATGAFRYVPESVGALAASAALLLIGRLIRSFRTRPITAANEKVNMWMF